MKPSAHASGTARSHAGPDRRPVVVGVESTGDSHVTIEWAAREAASRQVPLILVHTWNWGSVPMMSQYGDAEITYPREAAAP